MTKRPVTVLLLAAGSPGDFAFIKGLKQSEKYDVTLHAADIDPLKGNLYLPEIDEAYIIPRYDAANYQDAIFDLVEILGVDVLISDLDEELPMLSAMSVRLAEMGCHIVLPPENGLRICLDKMATYERLAGNVVQPKTVLGGSVKADCDNLLKKSGRVILKPRYLRGGRGVDLAENDQELDFYSDRHMKRGPFIVQQYIEGREYNCSMLHDMTGRLIYCAVRLKLENRLVKSNTIASKVVRDVMVREAAICAVRDIGLNRGFNNVEIIVSDGLPYVIDVNGGRWAGQDMNLLSSGVNQAEMYIDLALRVPVEPIDVPVGAISLKIKTDVVITEAQLDALVLMGVELK